MATLRWVSALSVLSIFAPSYGFVPPPDADPEAVSEASAAMQDLLNKDKSDLEALISSDEVVANVEFPSLNAPHVYQQTPHNIDAQSTAEGMAAAVAAMEASNELDALSLRTRAVSEEVVDQAPLSERARIAAQRAVALSQVRAQVEESERRRLEERTVASRREAVARASVRSRLEARIAEVQRKLLEAQRKQYQMNHQVRVAEQAIRNSGGEVPVIGLPASAGNLPNGAPGEAPLTLSQVGAKRGDDGTFLDTLIGRDRKTGEVPISRFLLFVTGVVIVVFILIWSCARLFKGKDKSVKLAGGKNAVPTRVKGAADMCEDWIRMPSKSDQRQQKEEERLREKMHTPARRQQTRHRSPPRSGSGTPRSKSSSDKPTPRSRIADVEAPSAKGYKDDEDQ